MGHKRKSVVELAGLYVLLVALMAALIVVVVSTYQRVSAIQACAEAAKEHRAAVGPEYKYTIWTGSEFFGVGTKVDSYEMSGDTVVCTKNGKELVFSKSTVFKIEEN